MRMMKSVKYNYGYLNIFPNFRHGNRKDGVGMSELSPMSMGPIKHSQNDVPEAKNLENFHQFSKCFESEIDKNGNPNSLFFENREKGFLDPIPHRHKENSGNKNVPLFFFWNEKKFTYIQSRQFYTTFYERFALQSKQFEKLKKYLEDGYNLCICGYDAYDITKSLEEHYLDGSKPFGHELVLYSLLVGECPWKKYKTEDF